MTAPTVAPRERWKTPPRGHHPGWRNTIVGIGKALHTDDPFSVTRQRIADAIARAVDFPTPDELRDDSLPTFGRELALHEIWDEIRDSEDVDHLDSCLTALYDWADENRVWIEP